MLELKNVQKTFNGAVAANTKYTLGDAGYDDKSSVAVAGVYDIYVAKDMSAMYFMEEGKIPGDASVDDSGPNTNPETPGVPGKPDTPEDPDAVIGPWSVCGSFTNNWSSDFTMVQKDGYYVAEGINIPAAAQFKFRKDRKWDEVRTYSGNVEKNTKYYLEENKDGNANIVVPGSGIYDIWLSLDASHFYLMEQGQVPSDN